MIDTEPALGVGKGPRRLELELPYGRIAVRTWGAGPAVLLLHGLGSSGASWAATAERLARDHLVVVPDLPGHGRSLCRNGDHSLAAMAAMLRDLLVALGESRASVVGHSLGGGLALHFAYQFPERCVHLALIDSGGLGTEVHPALRASALPGAGWVLGAWGAVAGLRRGLSRHRSPRQPGARRAPSGRFLKVLRHVVGPDGQLVNALEGLAVIAQVVPTLIVWGEDDPILPALHARAARDVAPEARIEIVPGAGHCPHLEHPDALEGLLRRLLAHRGPSVQDDDWGRLLRARSEGWLSAG